SGKPTLLYIPGLESSGLNLFSHAERLSEQFDVHGLVVDPECKVEFKSLCQSVAQYVQGAKTSNKPYILMGESFGAAVALSVYQELRDQQAINALVLINSVTALKHSHDQIKLNAIVERWGLRVFLEILFEHSPTVKELVQTVSHLVHSSSRKTSHHHVCVHGFMLTNLMALSQDVLEHRVRMWIGQACDAVDALTKDVDVPVLVVAGMQDKFLPSLKEALRLQQVIP
ncbi:unnamed protein product, partial [Phaeothamnion confervicola]